MRGMIKSWWNRRRSVPVSRLLRWPPMGRACVTLAAARGIPAGALDERPDGTADRFGQVGPCRDKTGKVRVASCCSRCCSQTSSGCGIP